MNKSFNPESSKKLPDNKTKNEFIQTIKNLSLDNKKQKAIIEYQREEIQNLTNRLLKLAHPDSKLENLGPEGFEKNDSGDGNILPLLEAIEEEPSGEKRSKLRQFLTDAFLNKDSKYYTMVNNFLVGLIFFSVACVIMESVPSIMKRWGDFFHWSESIVVALFTIEYIINIYVAKDKLTYIFGIWGIIDLLAILPSYFHLMDLRDIKMARTLRIVRFLRTIRMLRILKLSKNTTEKYKDAKMRANTLKIDLQIYLTTLFTVITIFSTLIYYAERNVSNTPFNSIPSAMWWCMVTISTVGYGDMYPSTIEGKFIAAITMIVGLALLGLLMNVIGKAMMTSLFGTSKLD